MKKKRIISFLMAVVLTVSGMCISHTPTVVYAEGENIQEVNLLEHKTIIASSTSNNCGPGLAVDGNTEDGNGSQQWNSAEMKTWAGSAETGTTKDGDTQKAQWLLIDRGEGSEEKTISSVKLWYNAKVWPMVYQIYTSDNSNFEEGTSITKKNLSDWTKIADVSRDSAFAQVTNSAGQNIADTNANTDTITTSTNPAMTSGAVAKRYVLLYIEKVNSQAPGKNVNIREFQMYTQMRVAADVNTVLNGITAEDISIDENGQILIDTDHAYGVRAYVRGSELENVVSNEGKVNGYNIGNRKVTLLIRVENEENSSTYAEKNLTINIEDHSENYPAGYFPAVSDQNAKPEVIPTLQEWYGYTGEFKLTETSKIIYRDTTQAGLLKVAQNMQADLKEITGLELSVTADEVPSAGDIYLESLAEDTYGVGEEGYLLKIDDMIRISAPTYTGCLYGTISVEQILYQAEDHLSVSKGITRDYPAYEVRGLMLDVARTPYRLSQLQDYAKIMLWYKMNEYHLHVNDNDNCNTNDSNTDYSKYAGFHRLESDRFPSLTSEVKEAGVPSGAINKDYYLNNEDYGGNPTYTKEEWIELQKLCANLGIDMMTEIDLPGHSLLYNKYAQKNPDQIEKLTGGIHYTSPGLTDTNGGKELLDLVGENKDRALWFAKELWNEYTAYDPDLGTSVIFGNVVHIGADEYWDKKTSGIKDAFANFADSLRQTIQSNLGSDTKIRMWGAGTGMFSTASNVLRDVDLTENYQLDIWSTGYENAKARAAEGYGIVNCRDAYTYGNPGRINRDVPNAEMLFEEWNPTIFGANNVLLGEPNLLGAKTVIWGDQSQEGMTEKDIHQRVLRAVSIMSEKTWGGTEDTDSFEEFEVRMAQLGEGPGTEIAMEVESETSLVLDYDFANVSSDGKKIYDQSGNGYHAELSSETKVSEEGYLILDGNALTTPLKTLSYPYSAAFTIKLTEEDAALNTIQSSIFSGYDGQLQIAGTAEGHLSGNVNYFTRDFGYTVPTDGTEVKIMLVGTFQGTKLYVNGSLVKFLYQADGQNDGLLNGSIKSMYSSFLLPLEKIGEGLHGKIKDLQVYNRALSAEEVALYYTDSWKNASAVTNVAQNTAAGGSGRPQREAPDTIERRVNVAFKVVDGDAFTEKEDPAAQPDVNTSETNSFWKGKRSDSSLRIDLGQIRTISHLEIQWRYDGKGKNFDIQVSQDGENWTTIKEIRENTQFFNTIMLDAPTEARYVRMQGITSNDGDGAIYMIQEFMIYESVDKSAMDALLSKAMELMETSDIDFESSNGIDRMLLEATVLATSARNNYTATNAEVEKATEKLKAALNLQEENPKYEVNFKDSTEASKYGTIKFSIQSARKGDLVAFSVKLKEGYRIKELKFIMGDGAEVPYELDENTGIGAFTMPEGDVTVDVSYCEISDRTEEDSVQPPTPDPDQSEIPSTTVNTPNVSGSSGNVMTSHVAGNAETGDQAQLMGWVMLAFFGAALFVPLWNYRRKAD